MGNPIYMIMFDRRIWSKVNADRWMNDNNHRILEFHMDCYFCRYIIAPIRLFKFKQIIDTNIPGISYVIRGCAMCMYS